MNIGIVGLGLIGGSLGRAFGKKTTNKVYAYDNDEKTMLKGKMMHAYDYVLNEKNIKNLDVLILALFPNGVLEALDSYTSKLKKGAIVIDCGGNKRKIAEKMKALALEYPDIFFIGGHPMAGKEFSGINHSSSSLFDNATMILTPINTNIEILSFIKDLFVGINFEGVVISDPKEHDEIISYTSQLAHIVSGAYIKNSAATEHYGFSAGSFRDMTRVAKLNPEMWSQLMLDNSDYLLKNLDILIKNLNDYRCSLENRDKNQLFKLLDEGRAIKEEVESLKNQKKAERVDK